MISQTPISVKYRLSFRVERLFYSNPQQRMMKSITAEALQMSVARLL